MWLKQERDMNINAQNKEWVSESRISPIHTACILLLFTFRPAGLSLLQTLNSPIGRWKSDGMLYSDRCKGQIDIQYNHIISYWVSKSIINKPYTDHFFIAIRCIWVILDYYYSYTDMYIGPLCKPCPISQSTHRVAQALCSVSLINSCVVQHPFIYILCDLSWMDVFNPPQTSHNGWVAR